jgi:pSer/pThr/pTyr-binding forkhead associated (FHA) protein
VPPVSATPQPRAGKPIPRAEAEPRARPQRPPIREERVSLHEERVPIHEERVSIREERVALRSDKATGKEPRGGFGPREDRTMPRGRAPVPPAGEPKRHTAHRAPFEPRDEAPASHPPTSRQGPVSRPAVEARPRMASRPDTEESAGSYGMIEETRPRRPIVEQLAAPPSGPRTERRGPPASITGPRQPPPPPSSRKSKSLEELMEQAKSFVCRSCSTPVPMGHKFCGRCGASVPPEILAARTQFFGQLQAPGKAKLILIRGEGVEGLSYQLNAEQHIVGRSGQLVFPDDPFVSPKHANLFYRNAKLVVRDEGSLNGVYIRVRGTVDIGFGDSFLAGEQLFRVDGAPKPNDGPAPDGTYFYSSPKHQSTFRVTQVLQGGASGMTVCARGATLQIGREGGDLNFPSDLYMSASHCKLEDVGGQLTLTDLNSRNGTYVRIKNERELAHGDYLFIGRKLLRVEITAA